MCRASGYRYLSTAHSFTKRSKDSFYTADNARSRPWSQWARGACRWKLCDWDQRTVETERKMCMKFSMAWILDIDSVWGVRLCCPIWKETGVQRIIQSSYVHHVIRLLHRRSIQLPRSCNVQFLGYCTLYSYQTNVLLLYKLSYANVISHGCHTIITLLYLTDLSYASIFL